MTLQEAIKSGLEFKRPGHAFWLNNNTDRYLCFYTREDVLADDWEIKEEKITITKSQLLKALDDSCQLLSSSYQGAFYGKVSREAILKTLGFKE